VAVDPLDVGEWQSSIDSLSCKKERGLKDGYYVSSTSLW